MIWGYPYFWKHPYTVCVSYENKSDKVSPSTVLPIKFEIVRADSFLGAYSNDFSTTKVISLIYHVSTYLTTPLKLNMEPENTPPWKGKSSSQPNHHFQVLWLWKNSGVYLIWFSCYTNFPWAPTGIFWIVETYDDKPNMVMKGQYWKKSGDHDLGCT